MYTYLRFLVNDFLDNLLGTLSPNQASTIAQFSVVVGTTATVESRSAKLATVYTTHYASSNFAFASLSALAGCSFPRRVLSWNKDISGNNINQNLSTRNYTIQFSTDIVVLCDHAAIFSYKYGHQVHINDIPIFSNCMRTRRAHAHSDIDACAHIQRAELARIHTVAHTRNIDTYTHVHIQKLSKVHRQNN